MSEQQPQNDIETCSFEYQSKSFHDIPL